MLDWLLPYPFVDLSNGGLGRVILTTLVIGLVLLLLVRLPKHVRE